MGREYSLSRVLIASIAVIASFIVLINEDISFKIVGIVLFTLVAVLASFVGSGVSRKMIAFGDRISAAFLRVLYYFALLLIILLMAFLFWTLISSFSEVGAHSSELSVELGRAVLTVFLGSAIFILLLVPYIQSLIVLILRKVIKNN